MTKLSNLFPMIRTRSEIEQEIRSKPVLWVQYQSWNQLHREMFLDYCTGARGMRILYDAYFKAVFDPDINPSNLVELLNILLDLEFPVSAVETMETASPLISDADASMMDLDIVVRLKDNSLVNIEMQRVGLLFPGQRAACYSSDLLLRQYMQIRKEDERSTFQDLRPVYTIVFFEKSPDIFHSDDMKATYFHHFRQTSDTGLKLPLLQEYIFIPLDIFQKAIHNKPVRERTELEAWLTFLSTDIPDEICELIEAYPLFASLYRILYEKFLMIEEGIRMFSEQLRILDRNTMNLMVEKFAQEIKELKETVEEKDAALEEQKTALEEKDAALEEQKAALEEKDAALEEQKTALEQQETVLKKKDAVIASAQKEISELREKLERMEQEKNS